MCVQMYWEFEMYMNIYDILVHEKSSLYHNLHFFLECVSFKPDHLSCKVDGSVNQVWHLDENRGLDMQYTDI